MPLESILVEREFYIEPTIPGKPIQRPLVATYEINGSFLFHDLVEDLPRIFYRLIDQAERSAHIQQVQLAASPQSTPLSLGSSAIFSGVGQFFRRPCIPHR